MECVICREGEQDEKLIVGVCDCTGSIGYHKSCLLLNYIVTDNPICMTCNKRYDCIPNIIPSGNVIMIKESILRQRRNETQKERDERQHQSYLLKIRQDPYYHIHAQMICLTRLTCILFICFTFPALCYHTPISSVISIHIVLTLLLYWIIGDAIVNASGCIPDEYDIYLERNEELWVIV